MSVRILCVIYLACPPLICYLSSRFFSPFKDWIKIFFLMTIFLISLVRNNFTLLKGLLKYDSHRMLTMFLSQGTLVRLCWELQGQTFLSFASPKQHQLFIKIAHKISIKLYGKFLLNNILSLRIFKIKNKI